MLFIDKIEFSSHMVKRDDDLSISLWTLQIMVWQTSHRWNWDKFTPSVREGLSGRVSSLCSVQWEATATAVYEPFATRFSLQKAKKLQREAESGGGQRIVPTKPLSTSLIQINSAKKYPILKKMMTTLKQQKSDILIIM